MRGMEGVKTWLSSQGAYFFDTGLENLFPYMISGSIPAVITLRHSLSMYALFVNSMIFFPQCLFC
jgi:hypothetical protein